MSISRLIGDLRNHVRRPVGVPEARILAIPTNFNPIERNLFDRACRMGRKQLFHDLYPFLHRRRRELFRFAGRHRGERCFILGGGPSLRKIDPSLLRGEVTFGMNNVFLIHDWLGFQPTYYVIEDQVVFLDRWRDIRERVTESTCFLPLQFSFPEFDRANHVHFRAMYEFEDVPGWPRFSPDPAAVVWIGGTVTYVCMQLAFWMGFREVFLLGMDHHYVKPTHVSTEGDVWTSNGEDPNHFHPSYFGQGYRWHDPRLDRMERAYQNARAVYEKAGRRLANATEGGRLEVFERVPFAGLFSAT